MGDTTPAAFDPKPIRLNNVGTFKAGGTILAGQVVAIHGTGVNFTVHPTVSGTTEAPVGVALESASTGEYFPVAGNGSILKICEGNGSAIDAGEGIMVSSVAGCVTTGAATAAAWWVGIALEDISKNGTGYVEVNIQYVPKGAS